MTAISRWRQGNRPRSPRKIARIALGAAICLGFMAASIVSSAAANAAQIVTTAATGHTYYVNCASGNDAGGGTTPGTAWHTLAHLNSITFQPGDSILLARRVTCDGVLQPRGSGTTGAPITVGAYGSGALPTIDGGGAPAAVLLENVQDWDLQQLNITDPGTADGTPRIGIYVLLTDYGVGHHYVIRDVNINDVPGCDCTFADPDGSVGSGGIVFRAAGSEVPTGFDGIQVSGNTISGVDGFGIATSSAWSYRSQFNFDQTPFVPMSKVRIIGNSLSNLGGNGIMVENGVNPLIAHNHVAGFARRADIASAGIYPLNSDSPVIQSNEVSGASEWALALDDDAGNSNALFQYNYSHDNIGGFMLFCAIAGSESNGAIVRYNISQNDMNSPLGSTVINNACPDPETNVKFYNNVVYTSAPALISNYGTASIKYSNNVFYGAPGGSTIQDSYGIFSHNLYYRITSVPSGDSNAVTADPRFADPGSGPGGYALECGSPAIDAGIAIPGNGGRDFYGWPVPAGGPPDVGAYQGPCPQAG